MLKKNLLLFMLTICGFMNLQAMEMIPSDSDAIKPYQEIIQQEQLLAKKNKNKEKNKDKTPKAETNTIGCKQCGKRHAAVA